jgi:chaperone modulatory protein CbpM
VDTFGFLRVARVEAAVLETWVEAGWIVPREDTEAQRFSEVDVARARLIQDLRHDLGVNDEGVAIILDLVDQIHGLRGRLRELCAALSAQPETVRDAIAAQLRTPASNSAQSAGSNDETSVGGVSTGSQ